MTVERDSSVQPNEPALIANTQVDNKDIKNEDSITTSDDHDPSSSTMVKAADHESHQSATQPTLEHDESTKPQTPNPSATNSQNQPPPTANPQIPDSDANDTATTKVETQNSSPSEDQPTTDQISTTQIPDSDANKPSATNDSLPTDQVIETVEPPSASQIPNPDVNEQSSTSDHGNELPTVVQPINPDSDVNKKATTFDSPKTTETKFEITNQEITSADETNKDIISSSDQERNYLVNLIDTELKFVKELCPKLGIHEDYIKKEAKVASILYEKLTNQEEPCDLKELKQLKKTVTKLKLQIPAKYRTYDVNGKKKNQQYGEENRGINYDRLLKQLPRLHSKLFHDDPLCKKIQQRYNELSRQSKLCLLCFSVFPENEAISRRLMVYWWIGEGLIPQEDVLEFGKSVEDCANDVFKELMAKEFIEPVSKSKDRYVATCKMHPMVRAALVMIADEVKFFDFDKYGNPKDFGKFDEFESPKDVPDIYPFGDPREYFDFFDKNRADISKSVELKELKGKSIEFVALPTNNDLPEKDIPSVVHRDVKPSSKKSKYYFYRKKVITTRSCKVCLMGSGLSKGITWEKLHMLFNVKDDILEFKPEWFLRMKNVNVVFLGRWQSSAAHHIEVDEFKFEESLDNMNHVRFFSLQGVSRISELPNSISKLESLLILDLRACHNLEKIPKTIGSLQCLTHLDISECYLLKDLPKEISSLQSLQVLKGFVVVDSPDRNVCTLQDLKKLENLRKLSMYTHMKDFPKESHLEALQKFETLRKLTILWGGHESKPQTDQSKQANAKKKEKHASMRLKKLVSKKKWVEGKMRRMNAFNNSTLGLRLEKLDLKCFPENVTPNWLTPGSLKGLKKLYIRGGQFSDLGQYQDIFEWDDSPCLPKETWNVQILRLKYLDELKMEWRELQSLFPKLTSLEKVKCPRLTLFPCNEHGVWIEKTPKTT